MLLSCVAMADGLQGSLKWLLAPVLARVALHRDNCDWSFLFLHLDAQNLNYQDEVFRSFFVNIWHFLKSPVLYAVFPVNVLIGDRLIRSCEVFVQCADNACWRGQINSKERQWNTIQKLNLYVNKNTQFWDWIIQELLHRLWKYRMDSRNSVF